MKFLAVLSLLPLALADCSTSNIDYHFQIQSVTPGTTPDSQRSDTCFQKGVLTLGIKNGQLVSTDGQIGYMASEADHERFNFDSTAPSDATFSNGWSMCDDGKLALRGNTAFYRCQAQPKHYNVYYQSWIDNCEMVNFAVIACNDKPTTTTSSSTASRTTTTSSSSSTTSSTTTTTTTTTKSSSSSSTTTLSLSTTTSSEHVYVNTTTICLSTGATGGPTISSANSTYYAPTTVPTIPISTAPIESTTKAGPSTTSVVTGGASSVHASAVVALAALVYLL